MRVVFRRHALERMVQRGVSREAVEATLRSPDLVEESRGGTFVAWKTINGERIKVVYSAEGGRVAVITVATR